eukprot:TRINITY_DN4566_c0_g1_i1.p1 TRINITY_DN4566_c0_g1~~TRINITY_DN4566_c0_g1_i1.p1  ORF type:complete len:850 (-),score=251.70 TRINITY_DN4566_c0_g1_i1:13-2562(-)
MDRVVILTFSSMKETYHLIIELYAGGNVILTEEDYTIITLIRRYAVKDIEVNVGFKYPLEFSKDLQDPITVEFIEKIFRKPEKDVHKFLSRHLQYGGPEVLHVLNNLGIEKSTPSKEIDPSMYGLIADGFNEMVQFAKLNEISPAYIISEIKNTKDGSEIEQYNFFLPMLYSQFADHAHIKEFSNYSECVDEFFSRIEAQKIQAQILQKENLVEKTLDKVREDHQKRISQYDESIRKANRSAELILQHVDLVENTIQRLRASVASKMNWNVIKELIKQEKSNGDPSASIINKLNLLEDEFTILLYDKWIDDYEEDDDVTSTVENISIKLSLSAHANATAYYDKKRKLEDKRQKTIEVENHALDNAERKARRQMQEIKTASKMNVVRNRYWFEKFYWFISSDNYVVVAGRDLQQNDILYRRYLQKGDLYFHANVIGAASCIVKNPSGDPVPDRTLEEAGSFALCYSSAWKNKVSTSTYWVHDDQVSKTAPSGEYIAAGGFMIRGKKNIMKHSQLVMGFGVLFKLSDESIIQHENDKLDEQDDSSWATDVEEEVNPDDEVLDDSDIEDDDNQDAYGGAENMSDSEELDMDMFSVPLVREENADDVAEGITLVEEIDETETVTNENVNNDQTTNTKERGPRPVEYKRGQKTRAKKREKYNWQTEEERQIAMEFLQGKKEVEEEKAPVENPKEMSKLEKVMLRKEIEERRTQQEREEEEIRNLFKQEKLELLTPEDIERLKELEADGLGINLSSFTGRPREGDELLYAIPVCAPFSTLKHYKYKVKVLPGNVKKGKSVNAARTLWLRNPDATDIEKELIKMIPDMDLSLSLISNSKVSAPGINKLIGKKKFKK